MRAAKSSLPKNEGQSILPRSRRVTGFRSTFHVESAHEGFLHLGVPAGPMTLLTVQGRKTGRPHTTPVGLFKLAGHRYIFDTFGNADWVRNLRTTREAVIGRGWSRKHVAALELDTDKAALVLREIFAPYVASRVRSSFLRMGYSLTRDSTMDDYAREARRHPGFELQDKE